MSLTMVVPSYVLRYDNGDVKMWDLRNMSLYWDTNVGNGVCGLEYDRRDIKVGMVVTGVFVILDYPS